MGRLTVVSDFRAPLDRVWSLFTDPERWKQWNTEWTEIRDVRGPFDHAGSGYTQVSRVLGREQLGTWEVVECKPKAWRSIAGTLPFGIPFRASDRFEDLGETTRVTVDVEWATPWGWFGRILESLMLPIMRRQFVANARRAAALLDAD